MEYTLCLLPLALILCVCKSLSILSRKIGLPEVIGFLVGGLLIGLIKYIPNQNILNETAIEGLGFISKIGVILIIFLAGIDTDLEKIKQTGVKSTIITICGVFFPLTLGFLITIAFYGGFSNIANTYKEALGYGCILTATSVSITVATLKELGKLNSSMGTCIISAAILDDIIGIVVLSLVLGVSGNETNSAKGMVKVLGNIVMNNALASSLSIVLFFMIFIPIGIIFAKIFKKIAGEGIHKRRIPILSFAFCFLYAFIAEELFGVADITGAYLAGLLLSTNKDKDYIDYKTDDISSIFFTPVFFANIGINISFESIDKTFITFGICFVIVGILGKLLGCGLSALALGFNVKESASIGIGMIVRAEVALVCADKLKNTINPSISTFVVILILVTSLVAPIILKLLNQE